MEKVNYVIKSDWDEPYYFMSKSKNNDCTVTIKFSSNINNAHCFYKLSDAKEILKLLEETSGNTFKIYSKDNLKRN
jgi:hypothetical protein